MNVWRGLFLFLVIGLLASVVMFPPAAHPQTSDYEQRLWQKNFLGWGGIAARCEGADDKYIVQICDALGNEAKFLAAVAKIHFIYTGRSTLPQHYLKTLRAKLKDPIYLTIEIQGLPIQHGLTSFYGRIWAGDFYSNAVDDGALKHEPKYRPKSGNLVIWEANAFWIGNADPISKRLTDELKEGIKSFITLYVKYRRPLPTAP